MQPTQTNYQIEGRHLRTFPSPVCAGRRRRPNARDASRPQDITRDVIHKHNVNTDNKLRASITVVSAPK